MPISKPGSQPVHTERKAGVLQLTIEVPALRNSIAAPGVLEGLLAGLDELENDKELHCAVLTGAGGAFCSGGDLRQLADTSEVETRARMQANASLYRRIALSEKLLIAAVDGPAYGAGLGLATCCDLIVAGETARFCSVFVRVGAMPDAGLFWSLPARVGVTKARQMMLFAERLLLPRRSLLAWQTVVSSPALHCPPPMRWPSAWCAGPAVLSAASRRGCVRLPWKWNRRWRSSWNMRLACSRARISGKGLRLFLRKENLYLKAAEVQRCRKPDPHSMMSRLRMKMHP